MQGQRHTFTLAIRGVKKPFERCNVLSEQVSVRTLHLRVWRCTTFPDFLYGLLSAKRHIRSFDVRGLRPSWPVARNFKRKRTDSWLERGREKRLVDFSESRSFEPYADKLPEGDFSHFSERLNASARKMSLSKIANFSSLRDNIFDLRVQALCRCRRVNTFLFVCSRRDTRPREKYGLWHTGLTGSWWWCLNMWRTSSNCHVPR